MENAINLSNLTAYIENPFTNGYSKEVINK